ncbi:MAG: hypothetical protein M1826_003835 [Phylliscum demangeonii]|nr:MAG: hypothetical protein M1826_003835 [Phylliscum demangeonii]
MAELEEDLQRAQSQVSGYREAVKERTYSVSESTSAAYLPTIPPRTSLGAWHAHEPDDRLETQVAKSAKFPSPGTHLILLDWQANGEELAEYRGVTWHLASTADTKSFHVEMLVLMVVLALRGRSRPIDANQIRRWQPVPPEFELVFDTVLGEKVLLRVEGGSASDGGEEMDHDSPDTYYALHPPPASSRHQFQSQARHLDSYKNPSPPTASTYRPQYPPSPSGHASHHPIPNRGLVR